MMKKPFRVIRDTLDHCYYYFYYLGYFNTLKRSGYDPNAKIPFDDISGEDIPEDNVPEEKPSEPENTNDEYNSGFVTVTKAPDPQPEINSGAALTGTIERVDDLERHLVSLQDQILTKIEEIDEDTRKILVNIGFQTNLLSGKRPTDYKVNTIDPIHLFTDDLAGNMRLLYGQLIKGGGSVTSHSDTIKYNRIEMTVDEINQVLSKGIFIINLYLDGSLIPSDEYKKRLDLIQKMRDIEYDDADYLHKPLDSE